MHGSDTFPRNRIRVLNDAAVQDDGDFVLYWMIANRRTRWNFSLQRAVDRARELKRPLVILEALRCDYPWASDRLHRFVLQGMADNAAALAGKPVTYLSYVEAERGAGRGLVEALAARAALVITDDFPAFFIPAMLERVAPRLGVRMEAIDSNGIVPMRATSRLFKTARSFRGFVHAGLIDLLGDFPRANPLARVSLPPAKGLSTITRRWSPANRERLATVSLAALPIDHAVSPVEMTGGPVAARKAWKRFRASVLPRYAAERNQPEAEATSALSPYLHFGHISAHQVVREILRDSDWTPEALARGRKGARSGFWGLDESAEGFLDQLVTWRELGFNMCAHGAYDRFDSLPDWALRTLTIHALDRREHVYDRGQFERAETHDRLWNAAQSQLVREGRIHNYLRMLWGKKILEWSATPRDALEIMVELNNRYALDGRDPNSYSGIFWTLGRYDRPWFPERPVFGTVRYMSSQNTARKLKVKGYIERYAP